MSIEDVNGMNAQFPFMSSQQVGGISPPAYMPPQRMQEEMALIGMRANAEVMKTHAKSEINLHEAELLLRMREDVKKEAACVADGFELSERGELARSQHFLLRPEQKYQAGNFILQSKPKILQSQGERKELLLIQLKVQERTRVAVLDLSRGEANYFARKFREAGCHLNLKRGETNELYVRFTEFLRDQAEVCIVPPYRGFVQVEGSEELKYINENMPIWEEFKNAAR